MHKKSLLDLCMFFQYKLLTNVQNECIMYTETNERGEENEQVKEKRR